MFYAIERFQSKLDSTILGSLLDTILDRTVIAGYTRVGYRLRTGMWSAADLQPMNGKVVLVTGGTSGLGLAAAEGFARLGATIWLPARTSNAASVPARKSWHGLPAATSGSASATSAT